MAKQLNVSLAFTADTSQAKAQIQSLQNQLSQLANNSFYKSQSLGITKDIQQATTLVTQLQAQLKQATTSTGTLDLSKFNDSLKRSGTSIADYKKALISLGPEGSQAFASLATSITSAEIPLKRSNALLQEFATSLANTARWQLSSSALHGFLDTIQSAYNYAQSLDRSLTDIQIVTGNSSAYMGEFAEKANSAAQALSTTTKNYADASLIFFQQGLSEEDVLDRTNTTIKMAQATGDSVNQVSSYMTAIWNNFYDGSETLEHYSDVITKLGAATASSSSEIAEGIQQFAGVSKTIGLSYDYATAALTTLTANTRQSATEIGNSLKTIFSRLQGLKLGETLEDGVDLNKYSNALKKIGVDILDANGDLREMDSILDDTAAKWDGLNQAQKVAFAETAAGTMQYTKLISLLDNWDDMKQNLNFAKGADGTLEEQAKIYADSWEGARKRVKAAAEGIYNDLIDKDFFTNFDNLFASALNGVDDLIDALGGLPGILGVIGTLVTQIFSAQIAQNIDNMVYTLRMNFGKKAKQELESRRNEANEALKDGMVLNKNTNEGQAQINAYQGQATLQQTLIDNAESLNAEEKEYVQLLLQANKAQGQAVIEAGKAADIEKAKTDSLKKQIAMQLTSSAKGGAVSRDEKGKVKKDASGENQLVSTQDIKNAEAAMTAFEALAVSVEKVKTMSTSFEGILGSSGTEAEKIQQLNGVLEQYKQEILETDNYSNQTKVAFQQMVDALAGERPSLEDFGYALENFRAELEQSTMGGDVFEGKLNALRIALLAAGATTKQVDEIIGMLSQQFNTQAQATADAQERLQALTNGTEAYKKQIQKMGTESKNFSDVLVSISSGLMAASAQVNSFKSAVSIWSSNSTAAEKFASVVSMVTTSIMLVTAVTKAYDAVVKSNILSKAANTASTLAHAAAEYVLTGAISANTAAMLANAATFLLHPVGLIVAGIMAAVTAFGIYTGVVEKNKKAIEERAKADQEAAQKSKEQSDKIKESADAYQEQYDAYLKAKEAKEDTYDIETQLNQMARDLADTYEAETGNLSGLNEELLIAQGNYEGLTEAIKKQQQELLNSSIADNERAQASTKAQFQSSMRDGKGRFDTAGDNSQKEVYKTDFNNGSLRGLWGKGEDSYYIGQALQEKGKDYSYISKTGGGDLGLETENRSSEDLIKGYEQVKDLVETATKLATEAGETDSLINSTLYKQMNDWLEKSEESYQNLKDLQDQYKDLKVQDVILKAQDELGTDLGEINSLADYYQLADKATEQLTQDLISQGVAEEEAADQAANIVNSYLAANASLEEYANTAEASRQAIQEATKPNEDGQDSYWTDKKQELEDYYKSLPEEDKELFVKLNFDAATSTEDLDNQLQTLQKIADVNTIQAKITTVNDAANTLVTDGADKLKDSGIDWGNEEEKIIDFNDFLQMGIAEQISYLKTLSDGYQGQLTDNVKEAKDAIDTQLEDVDNNIEKKAAEIKEKLNFDITDGKEVKKEDLNTLYLTDEDNALLEQYNALLAEKNDLLSQSKQISDTADNTEGFSSIAAISEALKDVDSDFDKISLLTSVWDGSAESAEEYRDAILDIISASDQLSGEEKLGMLLSQEWSDAEQKSQEYLATATEAVESLNGYTLSEKMDILKTLIGGSIQEATQYGQEIAKIISSDATATTAEKLDYLQQAMDAGVITAGQYKDALSDLIQNGELGTEGLQNLNTSGSIDDDTYSRKLTEVAQQYDSCTDSLEKYYQALNSHNSDQITAAQQDLEVSTRAAELGEQYDVNAERIELLAGAYADYVNGLKAVKDGTSDAAELMTDLATRDLNLNDGIEDLYDNWDDYQKILDTVNECGKDNKDTIKQQIAASDDLTDTLVSLRKNTAKLLNTNEDTFGDDFIIDNLDDIKAAAEGDEDALVRLQEAADKEIALQLDDSGVLDKLGITADEVANWAANLPEGEIDVNTDPYLQNLVWAMQMAGMAQEDIESKLSAMGIDVDLSPLDQSLNAAVAGAAASGDAMAENLSLDSTAVTQQVDASDTKQAVGWDATTNMVEAEGSVTNIKQTDKGGVEKLGDIPLKMSFPTVHVTPQKAEETEEKTLTAPALQVKSAHKTSGGNISHANSSGGRAARGGGGGGGGGRRGGGRRGGGGGGGGRTARRNSEQMKKPSEEIERYHTIGKQLDSLTKQYDKISKAKDRAYGTSKVKLMDQEIAKQKQIIAKQKEYLKAAKENLKLDKKKLQNGKTKYVDSNGNQQTVASGAQNYLGKSALFDKDGNITNYEELMKAAVKKYNDAVKEFNQHTTDDEAAKAQFEAAKQQYEGFTGWLKQYEETNELIADKAQDVIDAENELYDQRFEKTQYIMEIKIEVNDKKLEYLEYLLDKVDDSAHDAAEAIKLLGDTAQNALDERKINLQGLNDMFNNGNHKNLEGKGDLAKKMAAGDKKTIALLSKENFSDDEMKQIQDVMSNLLDINKKLREARQQVFEKMDDAFEDGVDKMDRLIDKQKHIQTMTESYGNIVDIVGKKSLGITSQMMKTYNANKVKQATNLLAESKTKMDSIQQQLDAAQAARDKAMKAGHKEDVKMWDESIKNMEDELQNAQEDFMSNWEDALQAARDAFDNNVDNMVDDFSTKVGGLTGSIAALQEKWDQNKTLEEQYVPQYEKIYQLTKLTRDINKSIDETKNVKAKRELASLQEEINGLQSDSKKMSEYDLEYLQKRYELKIAEMALEDAQNAKSQVRMTKDSEGNFSYVYTADEQQVAEAEQSYEDKLHEMQQMNAEYINTLQENMIKMEQEQAEKIAELSELYEVGSKEYQDALANLQKYYGKQLNYYGEQMNNVLSNNTTLYENDVKRYGELTDNKAMVDEKYIGDFSQTQLSVATGYENMEDLQDNWNKAADDMYKQVGQAANDYAAQNELAMEAAGTTMDDYANTMSTDVAQMTTDSDNLRGEMDDTAEQINTDFNTVVDSVKVFEEQYSDSIEAIVKSNEELYKSFLKVVQAHSKFQAVTSDNNKGSDGDTGGGNKDDTPKPPKQKKKKDNSDKAEGVAAAIWLWGDHSGWGDDPERARKLKEKGVTAAQAIINAKAQNGQLYAKYCNRMDEVRNKYSYGKFDTGGYTGDWSGEGRFAMLHQKEIVLNKDDTENFLKTVDIVRQISDMIDLNAMSASGGLGSLFAASVNKDNGVLEQNVHITAEFPNATNKDEILSAFDNVVNLASQYANRKR
jgi:TP901 family phage tail tape measure protein